MAEAFVAPDIVWMDGFIAGSLAKSSSHTYGRPDSAQSFIEEFTIAFLPPAAAGAKRSFNIAHQRHVDFAVRANTARVDVEI